MDLNGLMADFLERTRGKSISEILPILAEFRNKMPKDKAFSEEEKSAVLEKALAGMTDEEKNRIKAFLKMTIIGE